VRAALAVCATRASLRRTALIALCVGTVLSLANQADVVLGGGVSPATAAKVGFNYVVPFISSNLGVLASLSAVRPTGAPPTSHHRSPLGAGPAGRRAGDA
jgi:hypothetical protein